MPISFLADRHRVHRLGTIRLGHKEKRTRKDGTEYEMPVADPFFVLPDELIPLLGAEPTTIAIYFLSDNLEITFPHYMRRYKASGLRCLGDGDEILYRVNDGGVVDVSDYSAVTPDRKVVMEGNVVERVPCLGDQCPYYLNGECKPTGFLRFMIAKWPRLGYWRLICKQRAVIEIKTQLQLALDMFGRLRNIPFLLHRGEEVPIPVMTDKGMRDMPVRTQWIEIEPGWFGQNLLEAANMRKEAKQLRAAEAEENIRALYGETDNGDYEEATIEPAQVEEFSEELFDGEGEIVEPLPLEPIRPEDGKWWESLVKQAERQFGFEGESDCLAGLEEVNYDQSAMGKENAKDILAHLRLASDKRGKLL